MERRKHYTILLSENVEIEEKVIIAGVGLMIKNSLLGSILELNPVDERLMSVTLRGTVQTTFINAYMETAKTIGKTRKDTPS